MRETGTSIYYNYDAVARLTDEDWLDSGDTGLYAYDYQYDAAGNRARLTKDGVTTLSLPKTPSGPPANVASR